MAGIYIHVPFCRQACSYCDFYFVTRQKYRDPFVDKLVDEIRNSGDKLQDDTIQTIYFGGGTPSRLNAGQVERILQAIEETFEVHPEEITFEMNPDDVTEAYLKGLRDAGITRASMGVQSFQPELLNFMNRAHTRDEALECLHLLSEARFENYTVDLIYGNPGQTLDQLNRDLDILLDFDPPHVSAYSLTIEPKTRLGKQYKLGRLIPTEDDEVNRHFDLIGERLASQNIQRYEISNYSKPGREAVHNSNYWSHVPYLGFGPGAHSFLWDKGDFIARRITNQADLKHYLDAPTEQLTGSRECLNLMQLAEERIMLSLRTRKGLALDELQQRYDYELSEKQQDYLHKKEQEGVLHFNDHVQLTSEGLKIADAITLDLVTLHS